MINPKNNDENNDFTIAGTDFFTDTESFLNELTDSELLQVRGGVAEDAGGNEEEGRGWSTFSFFNCNNGVQYNEQL
jgi:hypothetical protein